MSVESKPSAVIVAVRVLYFAIAVGFSAAATFIASGAGIAFPLPLGIFLLPRLFIQYGLPALLVHAISTRKDWARVILAIWVAGCLPFKTLGLLADANEHPVFVSLDAILSLGELYAFYLLFTRASNQWFKPVRAA